MAIETQLMSVTLAIILGVLAAIVYSLRILVLLERRIARMDHHIELMVLSVLKDERKLLQAEEHLERIVSERLPANKASRKRAPAKKKK